MNKKLILCAAFLVAAVANTFACTNLIVGKNAYERRLHRYYR